MLSTKLRSYAYKITKCNAHHQSRGVEPWLTPRHRPHSLPRTRRRSRLASSSPVRCAARTHRETRLSGICDKKRGKCRYDGRTQSFLKGLKTTSSQNKLQGSGGTRKIERKRYISYRHFINYLQFSVTRVVSHDCCQDLYI